MKDYTAFTEIMNEFIGFFDELIPIEQQKLDAAVAQKVAAVEDCMNREQAFVLRLRGLEQKRERLQREMGEEELTFREIIERAPAREGERLKPLFLRLSERLSHFQSVRDGARDAIEVNLHMIRSRTEAGGVSYSPSGKKEKTSGGGFTSCSV